MFLRTVTFVLCSLVFGLCATPALAKPELYFLKNGLPVIVDERPNDPLVIVRLGVRAGAARDGAAGAGLSHFSEHLLAMPYVKYAQQNGMSANAMTGNDVVSYFIKGPSRRFKDIMSAFGESVSRREFTDVMFENERRAVTEETARRAGNPDIVLYETLSREAYLEHPYGYPSAGELALTPNVTKEIVSAYIRRAFITPNMVFVVVGGVKHEDVLEHAEKELGSIPIGPYAPVVLPTESERRFAHRVALTHKRKDARLGIAFSGVTYGHPDMGSLDMLGMILSSTQNAPLRKRLVETGLASSVSCGNETPMGPGLFTCEASTSGEKLPSVERIILDVLDGVGKHGITPNDFASARKLLALREETEVRSLYFMSGSLEGFWFNNRSISGFGGRTKALYGNVTMASIKDVARRYLKKERSTTVTIAPPQPETTVTSSAPPPTLTIVRSTLPDGSIALLVPARGYSSGMVNLFFPITKMGDAVSASALDLLPAVLKNLYAQLLSSSAFSDLRDLEINCLPTRELDGFTIHMSNIPRGKEKRAMELLSHLLGPKSLDGELLERAKQAFILEENEEKEDAWTKAKRAIRAHLFTTNHQYGRVPEGDMQREINEGALLGALELLRRTTPTLTIGGGEEQIAVLKNAWRKKADTVAVAEKTTEPPYARTSADMTMTASAKSTHIVYALRIPDVRGKDAVINATMSIASMELNDRLEKETREKSGLSYSQGAHLAQMRDATYLVLYVETSASPRAVEVRELMRTLVKELATTPIPEERLAILKERRITSFEMGEESLEKRMARASEWELFSHNGDKYMSVFAEANQRASSAQIARILTDALARNLDFSVIVTGTTPSQK